MVRTALRPVSSTMCTHLSNPFPHDRICISMSDLCPIRRSNVAFGERKIYLMHSGAYTVRDMSCINCDHYIGWKIVQAHEREERWKEGAYVVERHFVSVGSVVEGEYWDLQLFPKPAAK